MKYKIYLLVGSIVALWIGIEIAQWCDAQTACQGFNYRWFVYYPASGLILSFVLILSGCDISFSFFKITKEDEDNFRRDVLGEYTKEELREMEQEEAKAYNSAYRSAALWAPDNTPPGKETYIDYYGVKRNCTTNEVER